MKHRVPLHAKTRDGTDILIAAHMSSFQLKQVMRTWPTNHPMFEAIRKRVQTKSKTGPLLIVSVLTNEQAAELFELIFAKAPENIISTTIEPSD